MKNILFRCAIMLLHISTLYAQLHPVQAVSKDAVLDVDGMSIFGYDSLNKEYIYIGSIANKYSSESIANEFGWGSKYKSDSIMNEFGTFGSKYSSYSAFNTLATTPPIIINKNNEFVGYLTTNNLKQPAINTDDAIEIANNSYKFPISEHKDITFQNIPSSTSVGDIIPEQFTLFGNYPNPFNPATTIRFELPEQGVVSLKVYSVSGQLVSTLINGELPAGKQSAIWTPEQEGAGVYLYRLESKDKVIVKKMLYLK